MQYSCRGAMVIVPDYRVGVRYQALLVGRNEFGRWNIADYVEGAGDDNEVIRAGVRERSASSLEGRRDHDHIAGVVASCCRHLLRRQAAVPRGLRGEHSCGER